MKNSSVIECVVHTLQAGGVDVVLVVTCPHHPDVAPLAARAGAAVMELPKPTEDMRATIEEGLTYLQSKYHPAPEDAWLLAPGDFPAFSDRTVSQLLQHANIQISSGIIAPKYRGQRGHPLLLRWKHLEAIRNIAAHLGIDSFVHENQHELHEVEVNDPGIHLNLNTLSDYAVIQELLLHRD